MRLRAANIIAATVTILFGASISQGLVDTKLIDEVRGKAVLDAKDLQTIDSFLAESVQELVRTVDFTAIARTRTIIVTRQSSTQGQYAQKFSESALKHITAGFQYAGSLRDERRFIVATNLLILIEGLKDPALTDLALKMLDDKNQAVRYWAVRAVTNAGLLDRLTKSGAGGMQVIGQITNRLTGVVETSMPETLALMAEFAGRVDSAATEAAMSGLLIKIADVRIKSYNEWKVTYELVDAAILRVLCDKAALAGSSKPDLLRRFSQLYSCAIQRYISGGDMLSDTSKQHLASVIPETEEKCIGKLLGREQTALRRAVDGDDSAGLKQEHDRLFGELASKLRFDYGQNADGSSRTAPVVLPGLPKQAAAR